MDATSATRRSMVMICSPDAARMADSRWLRRRASRLDMGHHVVSPRQIWAHPTPKSNSALIFALFDLGVGWLRQTYFELRQRPIQRGEHDVVSPVRFGRTPHPSRTALSLIRTLTLVTTAAVLAACSTASTPEANYT